MVEIRKNATLLQLMILMPALFMCLSYIL